MSVAAVHILADNRSARPELAFEHGWSAWLDLGSRGNWLWDTGQTGMFLDNAAALGIDPATADGVALSHGHYDHAGGLPALFARGYAGKVAAHPGVLALRYSRRGASTYRSAGMGDGRLAGNPDWLLPVEDVRELAPGLTFVTGIARRPGFSAATANLFLDTAGHVPDAVVDDACLLVQGQNGPVVLLGCCHSGLANTLWHLRDRLGVERADAVVGGLHLGGADERTLEEARDALRAFEVRRLYAGHCTGDAATAYLREHCDGDVQATGCGMTIAL